MHAQVIVHAMLKVTHFVSVHNLLYEHHDKYWSTEYRHAQYKKNLRLFYCHRRVY